MRYISFAALLCAAYFIYAPTGKKEAPAPPVAAPVSAAPSTPSASSTDYLKRPLDRTHEVLDQLHKQTAQDTGL